MQNEVMSQIALRIPARLLNKVNFVTRRAKEKAKRDNLPTSFANRSTVIRIALDLGLDEAMKMLYPAANTRTTKQAKRTTVKRPGKRAK